MKINRFPTKKSIIKLIVFIFASLFLIYFSIWIWVASRVNIDTKTKSDTIIVLGARIYLHPNVLNPCMSTRVDQAINLYNHKYASKIIFSGGVDKEDGTIEAEAMKQLAIAKGISESDILTESKSASTYENIENSQSLMKQNHLNTAIIVTEPFHTPRTSLVAQKLNLNFTISPAYSQCWNNWKYLSRFLFREPAAMIQYFLQGRI